MDGKPIQFSTRTLFTVLLIAGLIFALIITNKPRPRPVDPYVTRLGNFFVGMSYEQAKPHLPTGAKRQPLSIGKEEPKQGDIVGFVHVIKGDENFVLFFDCSDHVVQIRRVLNEE